MSDSINDSLAASVLRLGNECRELAKENARLKAEFERLTNENGNNSVMKEEWYLKCMSARAEVERIKEVWVDKKMQEDRDYLLKENERLKNLSDSLMAQLNFDMDGWLPIETAPMDGTDILCFCVEPEFEGEENPWTEMRVCFYGILTESESCWMSHYGYIQHPTHWMSLPKPPVT